MAEVPLYDQANEANNASPIIIYYFYGLSDTDCFCRLLQQRFQETGLLSQMDRMNLQ